MKEGQDVEGGYMKRRFVQFLSFSMSLFLEVFLKNMVVIQKAILILFSLSHLVHNSIYT